MYIWRTPELPLGRSLRERKSHTLHSVPWSRINDRNCPLHLLKVSTGTTENRVLEGTGSVSGREFSMAERLNRTIIVPRWPRCLGFRRDRGQNLTLVSTETSPTPLPGSHVTHDGRHFTPTPTVRKGPSGQTEEESRYRGQSADRFPNRFVKEKESDWDLFCISDLQRKGPSRVLRNLSSHDRLNSVNVKVYRPWCVL